MHKYNPDIHHRRSIRLQGYDYSAAGIYFVTICTRDKLCLFGDVVGDEMVLNDAGSIVERCWRDIPVHFSDAVLNEFIVMPNHVHGIVVLNATNLLPNVGANHSVRANDYSPLPRNHPKGTSRTIGSIIRGFKIGVTKRIGYSLWQRNYYERIIRDDEERSRVVEYIINNPRKWKEDILWTNSTCFE